MVINHAPSGVIIENPVQLAEDTLIQILVHLPVKSLLRFRCASRNWCTLIKSPVFVTRHFRCNCKESILLKRYLPPENSTETSQEKDNVISFHNPDSLEFLISPSLSVPFLNDVAARKYVQTLGPCNGLVLLVYHQIIILCNPALREFKLLDPSPFAYPDCYCYGVDGSGFGYDANSKGFKFIEIFSLFENLAITLPDVDTYYYNREADTYFRINLYNSSTNSWSLIDFEVPPIWYNPGFDVFFRGTCHWQTRLFTDGPPPMGTVLAFDVSTEVFRQFEFPSSSDDGGRPALMILNQCLALVRYVDNWTNESSLIDIWVMKEYGVKESWTKELVIGPYHLTRPFLIWKNEWLVVDIDKQLASCALHANKIKKFQFHGFEDSLRARIFTESLISLN